MNKQTPISWLQQALHYIPKKEHQIIRQAISLVQLLDEQNSSANQNRIAISLTTVDILKKLNLDNTALAASIVYGSVQHTKLTQEDLTEHLNPEVIKLIFGIQKMSAIGEFYQEIHSHSKYHQNLDNIRKMFLAMVDDIRVVIIKLAEQLAILRYADTLSENIKKQLATETMAIYAPLTNRLGIAQIKWELEDLAFKYLEPKKYLEITAALQENFPKSQKHIEQAITILQKRLKQSKIKNITVNGRAKHVYSIYRKMKRKKIGMEGIYDITALRIFVPTITDCYKALSLVHESWEYIPQEFDDYIAFPKPNGYSSIHTAVYGPQNRAIEIQIRTYEMHNKAELGVAAHWVYKEGKQEANYQTKLSWLREVMDWQQEITTSKKNQINLQQIFSDYVYVFTPEGDILELPQGSTPLDFAYHVHSEIGHRCIGAKINNKISPLTYKLTTGDRVEILTSKNGTPSRDWLNTNLGFLNTSRAKSKVAGWFKKQSLEQNIAYGQEIIIHETRKLGLRKLDLKTAARKLHFKSSDELLFALGSGDLRFSSILSILKIETEKFLAEKTSTINLAKPSKPKSTSDIHIQEIDNLLVHTANCCKPIPGEEIIGYITQNRGITIHNAECTNVLYTLKMHPERVVAASWNKKTGNKYPVDIIVKAFNNSDLARNITNILAEEKVPTINLIQTNYPIENIVKIKITVEIINTNSLTKILNKINNLSEIIEIYRNNR